MSESVENQFDEKQIAAAIGIYDSELQFPSFPNNNNMTEVLGRVVSGKYAKTASVQDMLDDLLMIENYAVFLMDQENKQKRIINWCQSNLENLVGHEADNIPDYIGTYLQNRICYVKGNSPKGQILDRQRIVAQVKLDSISRIQYGLQRIADAIKVAINMRKERYNAFVE